MRICQCLAGLSGFAIFISIVGILLPLFMMLVPVVDVKYGKLTRLSRALSEIRVGFILSGTGTTLTFLIAYVSCPLLDLTVNSQIANSQVHHCYLSMVGSRL